MAAGSTVDITGLDKIELLRAMWEASQPAAFFTFAHGVPAPAWDDKEAEEVIKRYIDYFQGRPIKANLSADSVDSYLFDRDSRVPLAQIVASMREGGKQLPVMPPATPMCFYCQCYQSSTTLNGRPACESCNSMFGNDAVMAQVFGAPVSES